MPNVIPGLDALIAGQYPTLLQKFAPLKVGLLINQTGLTVEGVLAWEALKRVGFNILALFSPEHGPKGVLEGEITSSQLEDGTPILSLYGATKRPTPEMLQGLDAIICDLQDVGARFYTYAATIFEVMEACAPFGIKVLVLDRPNPLGGVIIEGPIIEPELMTFIGPAPLPITHGMTMGELAHFYQDWKQLDMDVEVAQVQGWKREMRWPETGLEWRRPSPNLPDFESAAWYPGLCLLEFSNLAVGRGTEAPFQILGSPEFNTAGFIESFQCEQPIRVEAIEFTPSHAVFANEKCQGVRFVADEPPAKPVELGHCVMAALRKSHPDFSREDWEKAGKLLGSHVVLDALWEEKLEVALEKVRTDAEIFRQTRARFSLYSTE